MNARELRTRFIQFFESKGHLRHDSSPLVPVDATGKLDETLLFTGAGMVQFKPYFRAIAKPPHTRLVTSQKCVRAVDIEEVGNPSHLTFFEMLGNFSFGDYFKEGAIEYAWEFLTSSDWLALDPNKLCVTVFETDDDAYALWSEVWKNAGFDPASKIHRLGEDKNYWPAGAFSAGPPGPCGPCSEIFYQVAPDADMVGDYLTDEAAGRWLEIWNLVFMQFEWKGELNDPAKPHLGYRKTGMDSLPKPCVDTGMGLERTAAVLGGLGDVYRTDVFTPILERIRQLVTTESKALANYTYGGDPKLDRCARIISDHIRTASFCVADGVIPSNNGRGYVLRRLIRRAMLVAWTHLGIKDLFLPRVYDGVIEALSNPYLELKERSEAIKSALGREENLFRGTMSDGNVRLTLVLENKQNASEIQGNKLSGRYAFHLYDTYGFPLEVTQELATEHGLTVDLDEYEASMKEAQARSRAAQGSVEKFGGKDEPIVLIGTDHANIQTVFVGYDRTEHISEIVQISPRFGKDKLSTGDLQICLNETPFYAESGGQVGDTGMIIGPHFWLKVTNTWKEMGQIWHDCTMEQIEPPINLTGLTPDQIRDKLNQSPLFTPVKAIVDAQRRNDITRNHTATHLLHAALRNTLGTHVTQAGSLVAPERLRFDFTHSEAMRPEQLAEVERSVNEQIATAKLVGILDGVPIDVARGQGAMMLFGEKYGDRVRMVQIPDYSLELCGGCHVRNVAEIGMFKIISEASSASGVRRIEAYTGRGAYAFVADRESLLKEASHALKTTPSELPRAAEKLQEQLRDLRKERDRLITQGGTEDKSSKTEVGNLNLYTATLEVGGPDAAKLLTDRLIEKDSLGVALVALKEQDKLIFFCKTGTEAQKSGAHAGNLARDVAKLTGGGGGGSPAFAQAGGKDQNKLTEALAQAAGILGSQVG